MLKIALTGNIASGKTAVQNYLSELGFPVLDTDIVCHKLLDASVEVKKVFADYDVLEGDKISREKLGKLVFSSPELKTKLENLLYPDLKDKIRLFFEENLNSQFAFVAAPQLFEAGMENLFDRIILVFTDDKIRKERLILRNNYSEDYANKRMKSQLSQEIKRKKSDYVICNNSDLETLKAETIKIVEQIH